SNKGEYRKFKTRKNQNNDFYNMNETIKRRFSEKNVKAWGLPGLVIIDGGKGQLDAAIRARDESARELAKSSSVKGDTLLAVPFIGLAKREERIVIQKDKSNVSLNSAILHKLGGFVGESKDFLLVNIPHNTNLVKLLQRIRDESHRFAVSYHSTLKQKR